MIDVQSIKDTAANIVDDGNEIAPILFYNSKNDIAIVPLNTIPKNQWKEYIFKIAKKEKLNQYILLVESWTVTLPPTHPLVKHLQSGKLRISDLPDDMKSEIAMLQQTYRNGVTNIWTAQIVTIKNGENRRKLLSWHLRDKYITGFSMKW